MRIISEKEYLKHKEKIESDPFLTAIHEAAHAVACLRLKIKFSYITIRKRKETFGKVQFNRYNFNLTSAIARKKIERIKRQIIMLGAGDAAESIYLILKGVNIARKDDSYIFFEQMKVEDKMTDDESIDCFSDLISLSLEEKKDLAIDRPWELVFANWDHIIAVTQELKKKGKLQYFQVRKLWKAY